MSHKADQISERLLDFCVKIVRLAARLRRSAVERHLSNQLLSSGTPAGANYEEARGAQSRADFVHKLQIVLKEMRESVFWLKLIQKSGIANDGITDELLDEASQLSRIIAKSIVTAKKGAGEFRDSSNKRS